tara:strand:- start:5863 stop:6627 length:765 start_codon:yes stop_codon:yes gene_type:complete
MIKSIQLVTTAFAILFGNFCFSQLDSVCLVKGDSIMAIYATKEVDSIIFYRPKITPIITDADGNIYTSVKIGTQEWMVENLKTSTYSDGTSIDSISGGDTWMDLTSGAWCNYKNNSDYDTIYGKLYNFYAVETEKLCPIGWHVPTENEWTVLTDYLEDNGHRGAEGTVLKSTSGWNLGHYGTDDYGWKGLPGGRLQQPYFGGFSTLNLLGAWWSSSEIGTTGKAYYRDMYISHGTVGRGLDDKVNGYSVRCLKD